MLEIERALDHKIILTHSKNFETVFLEIYQQNRKHMKTINKYLSI